MSELLVAEISLEILTSRNATPTHTPTHTHTETDRQTEMHTAYVRLALFQRSTLHIL